MTDDVQLSEHFKLSEFAQPSKPQWGEEFANGERYPELWVSDRLIPLCRQVLEPIRLKAGGNPMTVLSGWRSVAYNNELYSRVGTTPTNSQHSQGRAADIVVTGVPPGVLRDLVYQMWLARELPLLGGLGLYTGFVHVDTWILRPGHLRQWNGSRSAEQTT